MFKYPAYVINLDRCPERYERSFNRIQQAGFSLVERFPAIDAKNKEILEKEWLKYPQFKTKYFYRSIGEQGCFLSWINLLVSLRNAKHPFVTVFEDDVVFDSTFDETTVNEYWENTDKDFDMIYLGYIPAGSLMSLKKIHSSFVWTTHAIVFSYKGICNVLDCLLNYDHVYAIDNMFKTLMANRQIKHVCWSSSSG